MGEFSKRFAALSSEQRQLLERRLKEKGLQALLPADSPQAAVGEPRTQKRASERAGKGMRFSIFFFSDDGSESKDEKYRLLIECARFADRHGFAAVWTPERHFVDFGGLYPNPSVLSAALAMVTERIQIRAGSVALPLHHPVRVAEEWSVVDNLSNGRVAVSFASGWHPNDFIFAPDCYQSRKEVMFDHIKKVQRLWAGEPVSFNGVGEREVEVTILPKPIQAELPIWITSAGSPETWARAGEIGANILASFGYSIEVIEEMIGIYRRARAGHGHDPEAGIVTLMIHTFLGENDQHVKEQVRAPMCRYLRSYMRQSESITADPENVTEADKESLVGYAFENYFAASSLLGTVDKCGRLVDSLIDIGVDEIACLVDFGLDVESVLGGLSRLNELRERYKPSIAQAKTLT